jgi:DNA polymerase III epsilon subunit-like protein
MKLLVFDTETSGLPKSRFISPDTLDKWPHIVQFSYIIFDTETNELIEIKNNVVKIPESFIISPESINIHHITNEISSKIGLEIEDIIEEFFYYFMNSCDKLIGHNISFDINMLKVELLRIIYYNNSALTQKKIKLFKSYLHYLTNYTSICCTLKDSIDLCNIIVMDKYGKPYKKYPKLVELHEKLFNIVPNNLHNSLIDILVTLRCFMKMKFNKDLNHDCKKFIEISNENKIYI